MAWWLLAAGVVAVAGIGLLVLDGAKLGEEARLRAERAGLETQIAAAARQQEETSAEERAEREHLAQTEKVLGELRQLQSTWEWVAGNREQQRANDERIKSLEARHGMTVARVGDLTKSLARTAAARHELEGKRERIDAQLRLEETRKAGSAYHLWRAWLQTRGWLLVGAGVALVGWVVRAVVRGGQGEGRAASEA